MYDDEDNPTQYVHYDTCPISGGAKGLTKRKPSLLMVQRNLSHDLSAGYEIGTPTQTTVPPSTNHHTHSISISAQARVWKYPFN